MKKHSSQLAQSNAGRPPQRLAPPGPPRPGPSQPPGPSQAMPGRPPSSSSSSHSFLLLLTSAFSGSRTPARTLNPRPSSSRTMRAPSRPVAPATNTVLGSAAPAAPGHLGADALRAAHALRAAAAGGLSRRRGGDGARDATACPGSWRPPRSCAGCRRWQSQRGALGGRRRRRLLGLLAAALLGRSGQPALEGAQSAWHLPHAERGPPWKTLPLCKASGRALQPSLTGARCGRGPVGGCSLPGACPAGATRCPGAASRSYRPGDRRGCLSTRLGRAAWERAGPAPAALQLAARWSGRNLGEERGCPAPRWGSIARAFRLIAIGIGSDFPRLLCFAQATLAQNEA